MHRPRFSLLSGLALLAVVAAPQFHAFAQEMQADVHVPSRPQNITWGTFPIDKAPVATVKSGQTVRIDTLSHAGSTQDEAPGGVPGGLRREARRDPAGRARLLGGASGTLRQPGAGGGHVLTGPIYVEGAEPGDMLEVQILELQTRVPYGMNSTGPTRRRVPRRLSGREGRRHAARRFRRARAT